MATSDPACSSGVVVDGVDQGVQALLEGARPESIQAVETPGLPGGLLGVGVQPRRARSARRRRRPARPGCASGPSPSGASRFHRRTAAAHSPRQLGDHRDPGPDVLRPFGVVGGQRRHACPGMRCRRSAVHVVQRLRGQRELRRLAADLGQRGEPGPAVERAVLDALGHHHARRSAGTGPRTPSRHRPAGGRSRAACRRSPAGVATARVDRLGPGTRAPCGR